MTEQVTADLEVEEDLALDFRVYGSCYWRVVDGKKVRIHPQDIRYGHDGVPRDSSNAPAEVIQRGEVMNPPASAAQGAEAGNLNTPHRSGSGADPQGEKAQAAPTPAAPSCPRAEGCSRPKDCESAGYCLHMTSSDRFPRKLAGRCANGFERDRGSVVHLLPLESAWKAFCGKEPGRLSAGWVEPTSLISKWKLCPRCWRKRA